MAIQAAMEGLSASPWADEHFLYLVEADLAAGRLIAPFDMVLPQDAGYYVISPEAEHADTPKIVRFREWPIASGPHRAPWIWMR